MKKMIEKSIKGIGNKLYIVFIVLTILASLSSVVSLQKFNMTSTLVNDLISKDLKAITDSSEVSTSFAVIDTILSRMLTTDKTEDLLMYFKEIKRVKKNLVERVSNMSIPKKDETLLLKLFNEDQKEIEKVLKSQKHTLKLEKTLSNDISKIDKLHNTLTDIVLPIYDDEEFSLMIEIDEVLRKGNFKKSKAFVEKKSGKVSGLLKLQAEINAVKGVYLATYMLTNPQLIVPFKEKYVTSNFKIKELISDFDESLGEIKELSLGFLTYGEGNASIFNRVDELLKYKKEMLKYVNLIKYNHKYGDIMLSIISGDIHKESEYKFSDLLIQLHSSSAIILALLVIFILSIIIIILFFIRPLIITRLKTLSIKMEELRSGMLDDEIPIFGNDEITEMSELLERLRKEMKDKARLNKQMQEYTDDLEEARFNASEAQKEAELASASKSDFLANMSHEIRTPMHGVLGMTDLLSDTKLNSEQQGWVEIIKRSGENLLSIINDILDFSKIEAGKLEIENVSVNLYSIIKEATDILSMLAQEKNIKLLIDIDTNVPKFVMGDAKYIRQIILNLANNAIKFTEKGHVLIKVRSKIDVVNKIRIFFDIKDTGIGIPEDKQDYIFNKFSQAEESTTRKFGGTGLGLAISEQLVKLMSGEISVSSEGDSGSVFSFNILLEPLEEEKVLNVPEFNISKLRVLVVDNYSASRQILSKYLNGWGVYNKACTSAEDALEAINKEYEKKEPYDLCIIEYGLVDMNGIELVRKIREDDRYNDMECMMAASAGNIFSDRRLEQANFSAFLAKPFLPNELSNMIKVIFHLREKNEKKTGFITTYLVNKMFSLNFVETKDKFRQYKSKNVLVVEDLKTNIILIKKILGKHGCHIELALNGKEALQSLEKTDFDIIFMDCQMPIMDGFEATEAIREKEKRTKDCNKKHNVIVALTADATTGDRDKCLSAGMDDYLNKPFKPKDISIMLDKWLG